MRSSEVAAAAGVNLQAKLADLTVIAETLRAGIAAGCDDLETCAGNPDCPLPFLEIAQ